MVVRPIGLKSRCLV